MRDVKGRFGQGNPGGPGRPRRETEVEYLKVMREAVTLDEWQEICMAAKRDALKGDASARKWLASYLVGVPESKAGPLSGLPSKELALQMVEALYEAV